MLKSLRLLFARPVLPIVAIITLALGLGVNSAIFSLTREVLLRPLPYKDVDRLIGVFESNPRIGMMRTAVTPANYVAWRDRIDALEQTALFRRVSFNVSDNGNAVQVEGFLVDVNFFPMLGFEPQRGRGFNNEDVRPGRDSVVLLSDGFWRRRFASDASVVGRTIDVDGKPCTVIGILPETFKIFRVLNHEVDVYQPLVMDPNDREHSLNVYAKLKPNASLDSAAAQLKAAYASLPATDGLWTSEIELLSKNFSAGFRPILLALQWAVALVLLIACANIANLLLAASSDRRKEFAIRHALGGGPWRIARDLAGETLILTVTAAGISILIAMWIVAVLNNVVSFQDINRLQPFRVDGWVVAFTFLLTFAATFLLSLLPAGIAGRTNVVEALKDSSHGATTGVSNRRLRHALVIGELALAIVLTASALALARSAVALHGFERGVSIDHVMTGQVALQGPAYDDTQHLLRNATAMLERVAASPGIASAALVNYPPLSLIRVGVPVTIDGVAPPQAGQPWIARYWITSPNYFRTTGIPILEGRGFTDADDEMRPSVAIVSESFARRFWNSTDVIGRRVKTGFPPSNLFWVPRARRDWLTIVGVVGDVREDGLPFSGLPELYLPYAQNPTTTITFIARTAGQPPETATPLIREAVRAIDPQSAVSYEQSLDDVFRETFARPRELAWIVGAFAALAVILSAVGVYGVISYMVTVRTREIGIRVALGATPSRIVALVTGHAAGLTAAGAAIGIILSPMALQLFRGTLFGVGPYDPVTILAVAILLVAVSIIAAMIPAVRAARLSSLR